MMNVILNVIVGVVGVLALELFIVLISSVLELIRLALRKKKLNSSRLCEKFTIKRG